MNYKFILQYLDSEGNVMKETPMQTLRQIEAIIGIEYFQIRQLYLHNKNNTKAHPFIRSVAKKYRIIDNPELFKFEN